MSAAPTRHPDPLIDEVRQRRRELYATCGGDLSKLFEALREVQAEVPEKIIDWRPRRAPPLAGC